MAIVSKGYGANDLIHTLFNLAKAGVIGDAALLNIRCIKTLKDFNTAEEALKYCNETYCSQVTIKRKYAKIYSITLHLHQIIDFNLNDKSLVINTKNGPSNITKVTIKF